MIRKGATRLALVLVGLLLPLVVAEVFLRVKFRLLPPWERPQFWQYDPLLGWAKIPNAEGMFVGYEYQVEIEINSKGLRDEEVPYEKPEGEYRALALGDSFTAGLEIEQDKVWTEVLEDMLASTGKAQVLNAGTRGYGTDQEYLFLKSEGVKYDLDLVIVAFYENDPLDNSRAYHLGRFYAKPRFVLQDGELVLTNVPPPEVPLDLEHSAQDLLRRSSYLYRFLEEMLAKVSYKEIPDFVYIYSRVYPADLEEAWQVTEAILAAMKALTDSMGARLLLASVPNKVQVYQEEWDKAVKQYGMRAEDYELDKPNRLLSEICERHDILYLDLAPALRRDVAQGGDPYFTLDDHWNATGNRLVAQAIYDRLLEAGWLPGGSK